MKLIKYFVIGMIFGFVLVKAEVISWYRIQEMFRFQSFHMYGIIMSAIVIGIISIQLIKRLNVKTIKGESIVIEPKPFNKGIIFGGLIFGLGWAMTGACPGPLYALAGAGVPVMFIGLIAAVAGTWVYGWMKEKLPH
ncbi:MAG: YeeE/YedE family protein [Bacteroidota bacterium]|nr:YeeE/YedE family protein [Bacteroidota bacterium]